MKSKLALAFRKYHRLIAFITFLPVALIVITGMLATIEENWEFVNLGLSRSLILSIHTGSIFKVHAFYPILTGLGIIGLLVTGLSMFGRRSKKVKTLDLD
jgi:multidrug transporter EmrE-like cation transporter